MKYIIMCGGNYTKWETPKQLLFIKNERIIERTIRLLKENGIEDIAISSNNSVFNQFGVPVLKHDNFFIAEPNRATGFWVNAFYPIDDPVCYLCGDVIFSPNAIRTIINTQTNDIEFFASSPPFSKLYSKKWAEPFAFKVENTIHFKNAIKIVKENVHKFYRHPIAWELWQVIKGTPINHIDYKNYTAINDYTCDIDEIEDIEKIKVNIRD